MLISIVLGSSGTYGFSGDGGPGTSAIIRRPERLFGDSTGLVYLTDYGEYFFWCDHSNFVFRQ